MNKFLIIGSNSFSGSNFVSCLIKRKKKVFGVSRSKEKNSIFSSYKNLPNYKKYFKFQKINLNKNYDLNKLEKLIEKFKPEAIVNYAAQGMVAESWIAPEDWYNTNIISQVKLYNILKSKNFIKKIVHVTTPEVYGNQKNELNEKSIFKPSTPYAISRMSLDLHLDIYCKQFKIPIIFTRTSNVYGPCQDLYRIVPKTILNSVRKKKIFLDGGGKSIRSFIFIDDVSNATLKICNNGKIGETYHIATNKFISIRNLVKKIYSQRNLKYEKFISLKKDRIGKDQIYKLNSQKLRKNLKWKPLTDLKNGLKKTENWILNNLKKLKKLNTNYVHKK